MIGTKESLYVQGSPDKAKTYWKEIAWCCQHSPYDLPEGMEPWAGRYRILRPAQLSLTPMPPTYAWSQVEIDRDTGHVNPTGVGSALTMSA